MQSNLDVNAPPHELVDEGHYAADHASSMALVNSAEPRSTGRAAADLPPRARSEWQAKYGSWLTVTDTAVVCLAVALGQVGRFGPDIPAGTFDAWFVPAVSVAFAAVWLTTLSVLRTRSPRICGAGIEEYRRIVVASFWTFGVIVTVAYLFKLDIARGYVAIGLPLGVVGLLLSRLVWRRYARRQRLLGALQTAVLLVGERRAVVHLARELTRSPTDGFRIVAVSIPGYGSPCGETMLLGDKLVPIVGDENFVTAALPQSGADTVAIAGTEHFGVQGIRRLIWDLEPLGIDLVVSTGVMDIALSRLVMRSSSAVPLLHIEKPQYEGAKRLGKRIFDLCFAATALTLSAPLLVMAALAVKFSSRGPVFYAAERIGIDGRPFNMLKFRSMVPNADDVVGTLLSRNDSDGPMFKMRDDPRITPVGKILRRFSIDELPQFFNVLRGEMSVVGPRPPLRREVEAYTFDVRRRLLVKPGVTGLWQVSGRSDLSWDESVRLDLSYVDNWSMISDIVIAAKTVRAVLQRRGAY